MEKAFTLNINTAEQLGIGLFKYSFLPKSEFIIFNTALAQMLDYTTKELEKIEFDHLFFNIDDYKTFQDQLLDNKLVKFHEVIFEKKDKTAIWVAITASYVISKGGKEHLEGIIENITPHKEMEKDLLLEKDFLQGLLDNIPDAVYFKDRNNRITKVNTFYAQGTGLTPEQIMGKTDFDFFPYDQAKQMFDDDDSIITTGKPIVGKIEKTLLSDGTWNQVITTKIPMYDRIGEIVGTMGITRDMTAYANLEQEKMKMLINSLTVIGKALEMRDPYTFSHMRRVGVIAKKIAETFKWDENRLLGIRLAGDLHDIGKISIPLDILNKPGKLTELEYLFIQRHVDNCYDLIKNIEFPFPLAKSIHQHHERLDGTGYPGKLKRDDIILEARILAVSDVLEAITHHRPYRIGLGLDRAVEEIKRGSGICYDSEVVNAAVKLIEANNNQPFWNNDHKDN